MSNQIGVCRDECADKADYVLCMNACLDRPMMDLVRKEFGDAAAKKCEGFHRKKLRSLYQLNSNFVAAADKNAQLSPEFLRAGAREYWRLPKAPYPPGPDKVPEGVVRSEPDWTSYAAFLKGEGRECYKYDLLARVKQQLGVAPTQSRNWKFWVGAAALGFSAWYFSKKR